MFTMLRCRKKAPKATLVNIVNHFSLSRYMSYSWPCNMECVGRASGKWFTRFTGSLARDVSSGITTPGLRGSVEVATKSDRETLRELLLAPLQNFQGGIRGRETVLRQQDATVVSSSARRIDDRQNSFDCKSKSAMFDHTAIEMEGFRRSRRSDRGGDTRP